MAQTRCGRGEEVRPLPCTRRAQEGARTGRTSGGRGKGEREMQTHSLHSPLVHDFLYLMKMDQR